jgi:hypothetical protein
MKRNVDEKQYAGDLMSDVMIARLSLHILAAVIPHIKAEAMREAANVVGTLAERPYDTEPEFGVVLLIEGRLLARAADYDRQAKGMEE